MSKVFVGPGSVLVMASIGLVPLKPIQNMGHFFGWILVLFLTVGILFWLYHASEETTLFKKQMAEWDEEKYKTSNSKFQIILAFAGAGLMAAAGWFFMAIIYTSSIFLFISYFSVCKKYKAKLKSI